MKISLYILFLITVVFGIMYLISIVYRKYSKPSDDIIVRNRPAEMEDDPIAPLRSYRAPIYTREDFNKQGMAIWRLKQQIKQLRDEITYYKNNKHLYKWSHEIYIRLQEIEKIEEKLKVLESQHSAAEPYIRSGEPVWIDDKAKCTSYVMTGLVYLFIMLAAIYFFG